MMKILGIGNALVDILVKIDNDKLLDKFVLPKGSMQLVDLAFAQNLFDEIKSMSPVYASGGSAANTVHGASKLGASTGFIGTVGNDDLGKLFADDLQNNNITSFVGYGTQETGRATTLVSSDSERTFATYLGAASEISQKNISHDIFNKYDILHVEGYLVFNNELMKQVLDAAKRVDMIISFDMASYNVVEANLSFLKSVIPEYIDIVFANEQEAYAYTGKQPAEALDLLSKEVKTAIVKTGESGSMIKCNNEVFHVDAVPSVCIDTTGAGDLYAGGFLYGFSKKLSLDKCGSIGSMVAGKVVEEIGAKIPAEKWDDILSKVKEIEA